MDEIDGVFLAGCVAALAVALLLVAWRVKDLETDIELVRMTAPAGTGD